MASDGWGLAFFRAIQAACDLHKLFATIGFSSGILASILWGVRFRRLALSDRYPGSQSGVG
jgi:hypothetical protein